MKESKTSIRVFFCFYGIGMILSGISAINFTGDDSFYLDLLGGVSCIFGIGYLFLALTLPRRLNPAGASGVLSFLRLGYFLSLVNLFLMFLAGGGRLEKIAFPFIISTAVVWYLYRNVKRLSQNAITSHDPIEGG